MVELIEKKCSLEGVVGGRNSLPVHVPYLGCYLKTN